jgi:hypothetical protein
MRLSCLIFSLLLLNGCKQERNDSSNSAKINSSKDVVDDTLIRPHIKASEVNTIEVLDLDSILINGKGGFLMHPSKLKEYFGKPDSTGRVSHDCGGYFEEEEVSIDYYGRSSFESSKNMTVVKNINFQDGKFSVKTPDIILNKHTTITDIVNKFPVSGKKSYAWKDDSDAKEYIVIRLSPKLNYDDQWILKFYNGKLIDLEYWIPC